MAETTENGRGELESARQLLVTRCQMYLAKSSEQVLSSNATLTHIVNDNSNISFLHPTKIKKK